jgi:ATP-dependent DNA helicase RecG
MLSTENVNTEFKREYTPNIIKSAIAFANTNGGKIYVGVDDDGTVIGIENTDDVMLKITNAIRDSVKPDLTFFVLCSVVEKDGKNVIVVEVQKGTSCPYYIASKGIRPEGVYVRQGASTVPATTQAILKMIKETSGDKYEDAVSLNQELTFEYMSKVFENNNIELNESKFKSMGFLNADNNYTNLAFIFSDQCSYNIKLAVFQGTDMSVFKNRYELSGSVLKQLDEAYDIIDRYNDTSAEFDRLKRIDKRAYPVEAIREVLLNSICHRDYSVSASSLMSIFADRIEILSIGGLVSGVTQNDIMIGVSALRNKKLADVLYRLKFIEAYGTGIAKIRESYANFERKPDIIITDNAFKVILPNTQYSDSAATLSEDERKIVDFAKTKNGFSRQMIEEILGVSKTKAVNLINALCDRGIIYKEGKGRKVFYTV